MAKKRQRLPNSLAGGCPSFPAGLFASVASAVGHVVAQSPAGLPGAPSQLDRSGTIEIAKVAEPGAVFGELSALLDQPHTADVRTLETSEFHVADAAALLGQDPIALLYVAAVMARRLDGTNQALIELKSQLQAGQPPSVIGKTVEKMEGLLGASGTTLYAGDLFDSYG